jgi:hypothetical protein
MYPKTHIGIPAENNMSAENKYDDEPRLPTFEEALTEERLLRERSQLMEAAKQLAHLRLEMEEKVRREMETKIRHEMEVRIRQEIEDEASRLHHKIQQQCSKNMAMLPQLIKRFTQITGNFPTDMSKLQGVLSTFIETLAVDVVDVYVVSKAIIETNSQPAWYMVSFIICRDGVYGMQTRLCHGRGDIGMFGVPKRIYTFAEMLPSASIQESILLSFCERPINAFSHQDSVAISWANSAITTFDDVISSFPGTHSGIDMKLRS